MSGTIVRKGEFARMRNVDPSRVSQWISEGKLTGEALVGEGRTARINVEVATRQLLARLDVSQRFGNGLKTRLDLPAPAAAAASEPIARTAGLGSVAPRLPLGPDDQAAASAAPAALAPVAGDTVEDRIKLEKFRQVQLTTRRLEEADRLARGRYVLAADAAAEAGRIAGQMIATFEGGLVDMASAIAARYGLPSRDVLHELRAAFRALRTKAHASAAAAAAATDQDLPDPDDDRRFDA